MSSPKTTGVTLDLVPVAITAIGTHRTTCFPQIAHNTPAFVAAHRRTAAGNQRTTCFPQVAHYTPAFVAAHRRSLFTRAVRSSRKSQIWITHRSAALCSCHSLNPLHASVSKQGPSSGPDFSTEIPPAEPVVTINTVYSFSVSATTAAVSFASILLLLLLLRRDRHFYFLV